MSDIVVKVEDLSKQYRLGQVGTGTLSHDLNRWWHQIRGKEDPYLKIGEENDRTKKGDGKYVWALQDINFGIKQGEVLGIIGRNGAGKSTLLKILSRTTTPTTGHVKIKGRVASLLEVGTGFHPDLSGRDNIYLNGAILGMTRHEIKRNFDEIVSFAGVEKYVDTPVKRYSSGMYVRLAFAVAAHLEPEILIVDEVLAVGDAEFQKKCLGKMSEVSRKDGRTILFVSHNMAAISNLCGRSVFLRNGRIIGTGPTKEIIDQYISYGKENSGEILENEIQYSQRSPKGYFNAIRIISKGEITSNVTINEDVTVEMEYTITQDQAIVCPSIHLLDNMGTCVFSTFNGPSATINRDAFYGTPLKKGKYKSQCIIPGNFLNDIKYGINAFLVTEDFGEAGIAEEVLTFSVAETGEMRREYTGSWIGMVRPKMTWNTQFLNPIS